MTRTLESCGKAVSRASKANTILRLEHRGGRKREGEDGDVIFLPESLRGLGGCGARSRHVSKWSKAARRSRRRWCCPGEFIAGVPETLT